MKLSIRPENPLEAVVLALGMAPLTMMHTHVSLLRARTIMVATRVGVFEALAGGALTAAQIAERCGTSEPATAKIANALVASGYLRHAAGTYALTAFARKWMLADAPQSVRDKVLFEFVEWSYIEQLEPFVRTGRPIDIHHGASDAQWAAYQRAMRVLAGVAAPEIVRRTPVPSGATALLDVGGSHGFLSVAMCRRHPSLRAVVLDLPEAIAHAAPILAREQMGDRVVHREGDVLRDDLGVEAWDVVIVSQLVHHFDEPANRALAERIARALKPGGVVLVLELVRPQSPADAGQVGALLDLYFALTSRSGTWSEEEISAWQTGAGLVPRRTIRLKTVPGVVAIVAQKKGARRGTP